MKVVYDSQESKTVVKAIIQAAKAGRGKVEVPVERKTPKHDGDYLIVTDDGETIICERKTIIDAFNSLTTKETVGKIETNKLYRQISEIINIAKEKGYRPAIILEYQCYIPKNLRVPRYEIYKRVFSAVCRFSKWVTIIPTFDASHSGHVIVKIARDWCRPPLGK